MSFASSSSASSSSSQESLGFPPTRYMGRRMLRTAESVDELDALGFAGVPRRYARMNSSSSASSSDSESESISSSSIPVSHAHILPPPPPFPAPPTYGSHYAEPTEEDYLGFGGLRPRHGQAEQTAAGEVIMTTNGDVLKAKLRYRLHKMKKGKDAEEWHIFLNRSLKPGEAPWAPLGSSLWKVPKYELEHATQNGVMGGAIAGERRSSF